MLEWEELIRRGPEPSLLLRRRSSSRYHPAVTLHARGGFPLSRLYSSSKYNQGMTLTNFRPEVTSWTYELVSLSPSAPSSAVTSRVHDCVTPVALIGAVQVGSSALASSKLPFEPSAGQDADQA